jgi:hypothetical protein
MTYLYSLPVAESLNPHPTEAYEDPVKLFDHSAVEPFDITHQKMTPTATPLFQLHF